MLALPKERRAEIAQAEQDLLVEINRYFEKTRPMERIMNEALAALRRQWSRCCWNREVVTVHDALSKQTQI